MHSFYNTVDHRYTPPLMHCTLARFGAAFFANEAVLKCGFKRPVIPLKIVNFMDH